MSSLFAGSQDLLGFWRDIVSATDRITDVPPHAWLIEDYYDPDPSAPDMTYAKRGGYLDPVPFDPMEFGMPPTSIPATDTAQLLALVAARRVLEDAGRFSDEADHSRTSVILGVASATELVVEMGSRLQHPIWRKALRDAGLPESRVQEIVQRIKDHYQPWQESTFPGLLGNVVAGRIANRLNLGGSNFVTDAACASSISALQAGLHELYLGDSDMVIAGGVDALNDILMYMCFSKTPAFSLTGDCRPFSEDADGTLIGEGVGMLALRRLEDAEADGDPVYAVIRGLGASSDGKGSSVYAPRPEGQAKALRRAYEKADYSPATVELVEAHGTATKAGDAAEVRGLRSVFAPENEEGSRWCALGSVKSQIGHTKAAAGSAGLIKVALALHHKVLPPTLKVASPSARLGLDDGPLYINTEARPWIRGSDHPRRASVSSFGFGGSNFHVALEEYTGPGNRPERLRVWSEELVLLCADSPDGLADELAAVAEQIEAGRPLALIAHERASTFRAGASARVALVARSAEELAEKVERAATALAERDTAAFDAEAPGAGAAGAAAGTGGSRAGIAVPDADIAFGFGVPEPGKLAFVFPGQGSQYVGMGGPAARTFDDAREVWDRAADMEAFAADRLDRAVFPPPAFTDEERAEQSRRVTAMATAQPAIAAVSLGFLRLLRRLGVEPDAVAGHSFGELTALAAAGRIDEAELLATARRRGELMAEAADSRAGAMIALSADAESVAELIDEDDGVVIANDNAPAEVVVAGAVEAVEDFAERAEANGLRSVRLPVASAFHSEIVAESCEPFHEYLSTVTWGEAGFDVFANTTADVYPAGDDEARRLLADQLASPVRFREMIEAMHDAGVTHFVEVGPGRVLTKLIGHCLSDREHVAVALDDKKAAGLRAFWRGLGRLAVSGVELDLGVLSEGYRLPDPPAEAKPFEIMITGFNHDRPYPPEEGAAGVPGPNPEESAVASVAGGTDGSDAGSFANPATRPGELVPSSGANASSSAAQVHQATVEAHRRYQELMAESHRKFLDMAADALQRIDGDAAAPAAFAEAVKGIESATPGRGAAGSMAAGSMAEGAGHAGSVPSGEAPEPATALRREASVDAADAPAPAPTNERGAADATPGPASVDVTTLALEVVSEKTGYPVEMLDLDMEMEAGLGIDSIKQVEILSELQERLPGLPEVEPSELASLRTLRDVADKLSVGMPASLPTADDAPAAGPGAVSDARPASSDGADRGATPSPAAAAEQDAPGSTPADPAVDVTALALEVVAEKTGYPAEMLDLDMEMEAGLGIDSIKQVEILSELQERLPGLPEIEPSELASLRTLRDVAEKLSVGTPAPLPTADASAVDVTALALEVVAEKTGYPAEMLDLDMEMEAGLGIDSIKQVEILSELQERLPGLPEIEPSELASLRTLRDVADKLSGGVVAEPAAPAFAHDPTEVSAFVPTLVSELRPGFGLAALNGDAVVEVTNERPELASALVEGLRARGVGAEVVESPSASTSAVICLAGLGEHPSGPDGSLAVHTSAVQAARLVARHPEASERLFVTLQATGGHFGLAGDPGEGAWTAGLAGIVKTAAREWPGASLKAIDVADAEGTVEEILDELFLGGPALEVGIAADGERSVVRIEPLPAGDGVRPPIEPGSVVVVSGGARGVTASSVAELAETWGVRLALLGRSELTEWPEGVPLSTDPVQITGALAKSANERGETVDLAGLQSRAKSLAASAEVRMTLADMDARGIDAMYLSADVTEPEEVGAALEQVRQTWGSIDGIVHGAGVLRDKAIAEMTPDRVADVFGPKVTGLSVLLEATKEDPVQVIALFSSIAARAGNAGQCAYSAANEVLNKVAAAESHRRGEWCRVRSYNWGPWAGGMVDEGLAAHFESQGIALLDVDLGSRFFVEELGTVGGGVERVVLAAPSFPAVMQSFTVTADDDETGSGNGGGLAPALVADFALRLGQALKPVRTMRMYLEDFVSAIREWDPAHASGGKHTVEVHPIVAAIPGYRLIFKDSAGNAHHETMVRYSDNGSSPPPEIPSAGLEPWPFGAEAAYETVLGSARECRSIEALEGVSEEGGMALLRSPASLGWPPKALARGFDPAAFEGLIQLGELWAHHKAGAIQKLARMGSMVVHHLEAIPERLRSAFRARQTEGGTLFDFILATEEGDLVAELREVQFDTHGA